MKRSTLYANAAALLAAAATVQAATYTYDWHNAVVGDAKWSTAMNWFANMRPTGNNNTDELVFNLRRSIFPANTNILPGSNTIQDQANPFKLLSLTYAAMNEVSIKINKVLTNDSKLKFDHDIKMLTNDTSSTHTINVGITLGGGNYPLHFQGTGTASASGRVKITGIIDGTPGIKVNHAPGGTLELTGANTFGGGVEVAAGELLAGHNSALGSGMLTISGGAISAAGPANGVGRATYRVINPHQITGNFTVARGSNENTLDLGGPGTITGVRTVTLDGPKIMPVLPLTGPPIPEPRRDGPKKPLFLSGALTASNDAVLKFIRGPNGSEPTFTADKSRVDHPVPAAWVRIGGNGGMPGSPNFQAKIEAVGVVLEVTNTVLGSEAKKLPGVLIGDPNPNATQRQRTAFIGNKMGIFLNNYLPQRDFKTIGGDKTLFQQGNSPGTVTISGGGGFYMDALTGFSTFIEGLTPGDDPGQHSQLIINSNGPVTLVHDIPTQTRPVLFTTLSEVYTPDVGDRYKIIDQTSSLAPRLDSDDNLFEIGTNGAWIVTGGGSPGDRTLYDGTVFENGDGVMWMMRYGLVPGSDPGASSEDMNDVFLAVAGLDCNTNSVNDADDIAVGTSQDCNFNGVPDECEPDCNGNSVADACDIAAGTSNDCNGDGVPNECDPDCNSNGVPDGCDIAAGTSDDCDSDGVPDECEPDCNGNSVADACDIAEGTSDDCNGDGVPNECEPDCNANSVADGCDIVMETSPDCNLNNVPDECDIAAGASQDCNFSGVPDECDPDCNTNGLPDDCEQPGPLDGFALDFDGVDDFVGVPGFSAIAPTTEITVEIWQKVNAVRPQLTLAVTPDALANRMAAAVPSSDGRVYWDFGNTSAGGRLSYLPPEPIVGTWQHFAFTASQAGNFMRIYRNGVLEAVKTGMDPREPGGGALLIGGLPISRFGGEIDEVRIWNMARTQGQIQSTMNTTLNGDESGLLAYWRFDEGSGTLADDSAGNSAGMLVNGPSWVALYADYNENGVPDECEATGNCAGDADGDGDVDLNDYSGFAPCLSGPDAGLVPGCECSDLNANGDVDLLDFAEFQVLFTG